MYIWGSTIGLSPVVSVVVLWSLFILIELSDLLDGAAARKLNTVSGFGKLFDPFADVFARLTYFVCFSYTGIMPLWILSSLYIGNSASFFSVSFWLKKAWRWEHGQAVKPKLFSI